METFAAEALAFVERNAAAVFWLAILFALAETTALVSLLIPSTAILMGIGAIAATGRIELLPVCAGAALGAVLGSTLSWGLGRIWGGRMLALWPLSRHPEATQRAADTFARRGAATLIVGHFVGPLRSVVFLMAGAAGMSALRFQLWNIPGAIAWAVLIPLSGAAGGSVLGYLWSLWP